MELTSLEKWGIMSRRLKVYEKSPELRQGQRMMNALYDADPILYNHILSTEYDCFDDDTKVNNFLTKLVQEWSK